MSWKETQPAKFISDFWSPVLVTFLRIM